MWNIAKYLCCQGIFSLREDLLRVQLLYFILFIIISNGMHFNKSKINQMFAPSKNLVWIKFQNSYIRIRSKVGSNSPIFASLFPWSRRMWRRSGSSFILSMIMWRTRARFGSMASIPIWSITARGFGWMRSWSMKKLKSNALFIQCKKEYFYSCFRFFTLT